MNINFCS